MDFNNYKIDSGRTIVASPMRLTAAIKSSVTEQEYEDAVTEADSARMDGLTEEKLNRESPVEELMLEEAVENVSSLFEHELDFEIDRETEQVVIKVVDQNTKEVIKQIPPEELLALSRRLNELKGVFLDITE